MGIPKRNATTTFIAALYHPDCRFRKHHHHRQKRVPSVRILPLADRNLRRADFILSKLYNANFENSSLQGADLRFASLQGAILINTRLQGANLGFASLQGANLTGASLQGADLSRARLQGADLSRVNITGADFNRAEVKTAPKWQKIMQIIESGVSDPETREITRNRINRARARAAARPGSLHAFTINLSTKETFIGNVPPWMKPAVKIIQADRGAGFQVLMGDAFRQRRAPLLADIACASGAAAAKNITLRARRGPYILEDSYLSQMLLWEVDEPNGCNAVMALNQEAEDRLRTAIAEFLAKSDTARRTEFRQFQQNFSTYARRQKARAR
jgi:hypothetical protein